MTTQVVGKAGNTFDLTLSLPKAVPPWKKCQLIHGARYIQRVDRISVPIGFTVVAVRVGNFTLSNPKNFPWPTLRPGQQLRVTLANDSNALRMASIVLHGVEV